ncbi:MAG: GrpB family protein [Myxococcota bacterium]
MDEHQLAFKMKDFGLGLRRKTVEIAPYNWAWASAFDWLAQKIELQLRQRGGYKIEHIGSTSVPGMTAKPILDVLLIFESDMAVNSVIPLLEQLGFVYKGDAISQVQQTESDPGRHFFALYDLEGKIDYAHLHLFAEDHPEWEQKVYFRDALRKNPTLAQKYIQLKQDLMNANSTRLEYTLGKDAFINSL